jgi:hypothetical protein
MTIALLALPTAGPPGIRRGCSLANSAGTYEFAREHPATSGGPAATARSARLLTAERVFATAGCAGAMFAHSGRDA